MTKSPSEVLETNNFDQCNNSFFYYRISIMFAVTAFQKPIIIADETELYHEVLEI